MSYYPRQPGRAAGEIQDPGRSRCWLWISRAGYDRRCSQLYNLSVWMRGNREDRDAPSIVVKMMDALKELLRDRTGRDRTGAGVNLSLGKLTANYNVSHQSYALGLTSTPISRTPNSLPVQLVNGASVCYLIYKIASLAAQSSWLADSGLRFTRVPEVVSTLSPCRTQVCSAHQRLDLRRKACQFVSQAEAS
jgi:hypothetical protein